MDKSLPPRLELLAALGQPSRHRIAIELAAGPRCVTELAALIGLSQSCTTRHVQALERAGCVHVARDGKRVRIRLRGEAVEVRALLAWLADGAPAAGHARAGGHAEQPAVAETPARRGTRKVTPSAAPDPSPRRVSAPAAHERADSGKSPPAMGAEDNVVPAPATRRAEQLEDYLL